LLTPNEKRAPSSLFYQLRFNFGAEVAENLQFFTAP